MNKETRGNMCKNKLISKSALPTPSELAGSPKLLSPPLRCRRPQDGGSPPVSATGAAPALSPSGPSRSTAVGCPPLQGCSRLETLSRAVRCQVLAGVEKSDAESPRAPGSRRKSEKQRRAPSLPRTPWGGGRRGWERGEAARCPGRPACSCSSMKHGGLASGRGRGDGCCQA